MDFMTHLPWTSQGHDTLWVIVDRVTKSAHFQAMWDDLHSGEILQVIHMEDCSVT